MKFLPFGKDLSLKDMLSSEVLFVEFTSKSEIKKDAGIHMNQHVLHQFSNLIQWIVLF